MSNSDVGNRSVQTEQAGAWVGDWSPLNRVYRVTCDGCGGVSAFTELPEIPGGDEAYCEGCDAEWTHVLGEIDLEGQLRFA